MTKLELQNQIATIEKSMARITSPAVLAIAEKNLKEAREQLAALEGASPSPAPSGGGSELEKLYEHREKFRKGLQSSNAIVQKASKMALPKVSELEKLYEAREKLRKGLQSSNAIGQNPHLHLQGVCRNQRQKHPKFPQQNRCQHLQRVGVSQVPLHRCLHQPLQSVVANQRQKHPQK